MKTQKNTSTKKLGNTLRSSKIRYNPRSIIIRHKEEIQDLLNEGYYLTDIYRKICDIYKDDIELGKLQITQQNFYKVWKRISKSTNRAIGKEGIRKITPKRKNKKKVVWDSSSTNEKHPFLEE